MGKTVEKVTGSLWKWKGHRIKPYHENILINLGRGIVILPFLVLSAILFWIFGFESLLVDVLIIFFALGLSLLLLRYVREKEDKSYDILLRKQLLAKLIRDNGLMEEVQRQKDGGRIVTKIKYYPKVYYQERADDGFVQVTFPLKSKNQDKHLKMENDLEIAFYGELMSKNMGKNYVEYKLIMDLVKQRISIDDVTVEKGSMRLMKDVYWEYDKLPHMLIAGGTGGGKTYFILTLIKTILQGNGILYICDPKRADLSDLKTVMPGSVFDTPDEMIGVLVKFMSDMLKQTEKMKGMPDYKTGNNYASVGLPPHFLIFDEYVAFCEMLDYKQRGIVSNCMKQIAMLGRQAGYFLILGCQRPDAKYFEDGMRDQFNFRVTLGKMYPIGYSMMFGDVDKEFGNKEIKGRGYADSGFGVIHEFYAPLVPPGYEFLKVIGELVKVREERERSAVA